MYIWLQIMSSNNFEENNLKPWLLIVLLPWSSFRIKICWWCGSSLFQRFKIDHYHHHHHQSHDRCGRWGERMDTSTNNDLPISLSWAAPSISFNHIPVHSFILSTCRSLRRPSSTVPWRMIFVSVSCHSTWANHTIFDLLIVVIMVSWRPAIEFIQSQTYSLVLCSK